MYPTYVPYHTWQLCRASAPPFITSVWGMAPFHTPDRTLEFLLFSLDSYKWKEMTYLHRLLRFTSLTEIDALSVVHNFLINFCKILINFLCKFLYMAPVPFYYSCVLLLFFSEELGPHVCYASAWVLSLLSCFCQSLQLKHHLFSKASHSPHWDPLTSKVFMPVYMISVCEPNMANPYLAR